MHTRYLGDENRDSYWKSAVAQAIFSRACASSDGKSKELKLTLPHVVIPGKYTV